MDVSKVNAALTLAHTELRNVVAAQAKIISDPKSSVADIAGASRALNVAGRIDTTLTKAESRIAGALKKLAPREKKAKPAATEAPAAPAKGKGK